MEYCYSYGIPFSFVILSHRDSKEEDISGEDPLSVPPLLTVLNLFMIKSSLRYSREKQFFLCPRYLDDHLSFLV